MKYESTRQPPPRHGPREGAVQCQPLLASPRRHGQPYKWTVVWRLLFQCARHWASAGRGTGPGRDDRVRAFTAYTLRHTGLILFVLVDVTKCRALIKGDAEKKKAQNGVYFPLGSPGAVRSALFLMNKWGAWPLRVLAGRCNKTEYF